MLFGWNEMGCVEGISIGSNIYVLYVKFCVKAEKSTATRIILSGVVLSSSGNYRCEVSGEAPLFQTASSSTLLMVVGTTYCYIEEIASLTYAVTCPAVFNMPDIQMITIMIKYLANI